MTLLANDGNRTSPSFSDRCKRVFLGKPMITDQLQHERLSNPVALGVLSPDAISSTAYGPEQILIELLPAAGLAAFALLLPVTGVILVILVLVAASYRQVVMTYTRAGGPYSLAITVGVVIIICYANLRGLKEAGRPFAVPTYFFIIMISLTIVIGVA